MVYYLINIYKDIGGQINIINTVVGTFHGNNRFFYIVTTIQKKKIQFKEVLFDNLRLTLRNNMNGTFIITRSLAKLAICMLHNTIFLAHYVNKSFNGWNV
jgi:hypothetical protein